MSDIGKRLSSEGYPFSRRPAPDRSAFGSPTGLRSRDYGLFPNHDAASNDIPEPLGPRGRDESGQHVNVEPGRPPVQEPGAWGWEHLVAKDERRPRIPPQVERYAEIPVTATTGKLLDRSAGFTWRTIQIDNYSAQYLYVPAAARYVGPFVYGAQFPVQAGSSKVEVDAGAPAGVTQNALAATTQIFSVTVIEDCNEYSPGIAIIPPGTVALSISGTGPMVKGSSLSVVPDLIATADILDGFSTVMAAGTTTLITIPAGRTWVGVVGLSAAITNNAAATSAASVGAQITTANGTGVVTPAAGTYARIDAAAGQNAAGGTVGTQGSNSVAGQRLVVQASVAGTALVQLVVTQSGGAGFQASGWAIGELQ